MVYDVSNPAAPKFLDFKTGDAPEGLLLFQLRKVLPKFDGGEQ
jgi:hypothetical protein